MAAETEARSLPDSDHVLPETVDVAGAVALMADAGDDESSETTQEAAPTTEELEGEPVEAGQEPAERETVDADGAPEFWSAEDKAAWQEVPEGLRPVIAKYEQQRIAFVNEKTREAASHIKEVREEAARVAQGAAGIVEQSAAWWQQNGPAFQQAFADKWSSVDWNKLAEENPAEWTKLRQQRDNESALLAEANRRGQADIALASQRAEQALLEARRSEHAKLASRLPEYFGAQKAQQTYDELGRFLFAKGIPADRIAAIHEAPVIELALAAMRFEKAQQLALRSRQGGDAGTTAKTTPTRVAPGPAGRTGNRNADAARQVGERFRRSGGTSIADAAELIRLSGL